MVWSVPAAAFCKGTFARLRENRMNNIRRHKAKYRSGAAGGHRPYNHQGDMLSFLDGVGKDASQRHVTNMRRGKVCP